MTSHPLVDQVFRAISQQIDQARRNGLAGPVSLSLELDEPPVKIHIELAPSTPNGEPS